MDSLPIWLRTTVLTLFSPGGPGGLWGYIPYTIYRFAPEFIKLSSRHLDHLAIHRRTISALGWTMIGGGALLYGSLAWSFTTKGKGTPAPYDPPKVKR